MGIMVVITIILMGYDGIQSTISTGNIMGTLAGKSTSSFDDFPSSKSPFTAMVFQSPCFSIPEGTYIHMGWDCYT